MQSVWFSYRFFDWLLCRLTRLNPLSVGVSHITRYWLGLHLWFPFIALLADVRPLPRQLWAKQQAQNHSDGECFHSFAFVRRSALLNAGPEARGQIELLIARR